MQEVESTVQSALARVHTEAEIDHRLVACMGRVRQRRVSRQVDHYRHVASYGHSGQLFEEAQVSSQAVPFFRSIIGLLEYTSNKRKYEMASQFSFAKQKGKTYFLGKLKRCNQNGSCTYKMA